MTGKRILICCNRTMSLGGIEKALTTFVKAFDTENNDITLVLLDDSGDLFPQLCVDNLGIIYTRNIFNQNPIKEDIKALKIFEIVKGLWYRFRLRTNKGWYEDIMYTYKIFRRKLHIKGHFDTAISFTTDYSDLSMVLDSDADKRIAFVHADASQNPKIARYNDSLLRKFNKIYCVSQSSKDLFLKVHPKCINQMDIFHNIILADEIIKQSQEPDVGMVHNGSAILCTVGRLSPEKGQDMIPETAKLLKDAGHKFCWYLIGEGELLTAIQTKIREYQVEDCIKLLGRKANPYPYMANCDIYVQTSVTEAYCITVGEARVLRKPIVTTPFTSVDEQIINNFNGIITESFSPQSLFIAIDYLLRHSDVQNSFVLNTMTGTSTDMQNLYAYIED